MANGFKILGTQVRAGINYAVTIPGVVIRSAVSISEGYGAITELSGESGTTEAVVMANDMVDLNVTGYVSADADAMPKNGDTITISGYTIAWIDGVSVAEVAEGAATFTCTAHGRNKG